MSHLLLALLTGLLAGPGPAAPTINRAPWFGTTHRVIARVAETRLSKPALAEISRLLGSQTIVDVAAWADDVKRERPATAPWHYVDIPITDTAYDSLRWCPAGNCVVGALERQIAILGDKARPDSARSEALKWVVHLIGDVHQPLHAGDRGDRGGNDVKLTLLGTQSNLHAVWDGGLLAAIGRSDDELVADLEKRISGRTDLTQLGLGSPSNWAMQSHDVSRDVVYRFLPQSLELDQGYVDACRAALMEQLVRASVRLTAVLERTLGH